MENKAKFTWEIETTNPDKYNDLIEGLSGITDPELGYSVVELGLIREIKLTDQGAFIRMILTTPFCPYGPSMLEEPARRSNKSSEFQPVWSLAWNPGLLK